MALTPRKSIEEVIAETPYPPDAFEFVREGVGQAVDNVHGKRNKDEQIVDNWMAENETPFEQLVDMLDADELPEDICEHIERAGGVERFNRHVSGAELSWALRDLAIERWGRLAPVVLRRWGVTRTEDFGHIVFAMVRNDYLQAQSSDRLADFMNVFDFKEAFETSPTR